MVSVIQWTHADQVYLWELFSFSVLLASFCSHPWLSIFLFTLSLSSSSLTPLCFFPLHYCLEIKAIVVLVDLNEFPSVFQKVQHSHSRHQKTTSNLPRINSKGILKFNEIWPLEGAMYISSMVELSGAPRKV